VPLERPHPTWCQSASLHVACYLSPQVLVSVTGLELSYTQAPDELKSWVMALYLASISIGNAITAAVNAAITRPDGSARLSDVAYMQLFTSLMLVAAVLFVPVVISGDVEDAAAIAAARAASEQPVGASATRNGSLAGLLRATGGGGSSTVVSDVESIESSAAIEIGSPDSATNQFQAFR
jgi:hypothetical protein